MTRLYSGLDVSDRLTHICIVDDEGRIAWRGACATDPEVLAKTLKSHAPGLVRVVLETGSLSAFLYHGLIERGVPAICICARHAKGVLSARVNKSDVHDAEGLAQLARTGWFKAVHIKDSAAIPPSDHLVADKAYDSNDLRAWLTERGTRPVIPPKRHRKVKLDCDSAIYRQRNIIERMFCRFKDWRRVATRFDRNIKTFMATIAIAATVIWWL